MNQQYHQPFAAGMFFILMASLPGVLNAAGPSATNDFNVRAFGAAGDGKTLDSEAINKAIDAAAKSGGGTVTVPQGTYLCGSIHLKSNINLLIDAGATILGAPQEMKAYDPAEPFPGHAYQDGGHSHFHNSLIWGENLTNVTVSGRGTIKGGGLVTEVPLFDRLNGIPKTEESAPSANEMRIGNKAICLKLCRNVIIHDVTIAHGGHFAILATGCDNLTVDNVTIDTDRDGMDIDCCRNTIISNCRVNSPNDDGICPKSTYALGEARVTENLTIVNCQVSGFPEGALLNGPMLTGTGRRGTGRIKFGTESSGGFRNCTVSNCTFRSCHGLALEEVDGGILEDITISNITMVDVADYAIYITTGKRNRTPNLTTKSRARNILISDIIIDGVSKMSGIQIMGLPEQPIEGVRLDNIRLISEGGATAADATIVPKELGVHYPEAGNLGTLPAYGVYARHLHGLELENINVSFRTKDLRPAASFSDVQGLDIDNFKPQLSEGVPGAVFAPDVHDLVIRDSPALQPSK
jgi:polygalacturonase